ncbi:hypothetical protein FHG87_008890 [Trinorchestia longiramus]|nr:hypothetical protein FHG87_008890 [Trinorchestia longiramus]
MHFSQLVRVACAIAASRSRYHLQLVSPQGVLRSSELVHFSTLLQRHCPGTPNHFHPILLTNDSWCSHAVKGHHCTSTPIDDGAQTLLLMHITSAHHLQLLSHVISFVVNGSGISAWEAYRPSPSVPAILRSLTVVDLPPSHDQLEALTREPWSRRMNLTGLTLRCGVLEYFQYAMVTQASAGRVTVAGWSADIWDTLRSTLGFRFECVEPLDGLWGATIRKDGRPEGVFGDVASGRVDLGLPYNVLESRHFDYVDALHPVGKTWYVLILRRPSSVDGSANYTQELTWQSWTAAGILFFSSILISKLFFMVSEANRDSTPSSSLMYSVRIFCNMGRTSKDLVPNMDPDAAGGGDGAARLLLIITHHHTHQRQSRVAIP